MADIMQTEEWLYEEAKSYIIKRFNVVESESQTNKTEGHEGTLTKDLSFKSSEKAETEEEDVDEEFEDEDEFDDIEYDDDCELDCDELYEDEYDEYDTTVVGILRVKIDQANDVVLSGGLFGMGVRVFEVNSQGAANKGTPAYKANNVCGVHCLPVHNAKGQLIFENFDKTLTDFDAEFFSLTLSDLIMRNADGLYNRRQALEKIEQINIPGGNKCKVRLNAQFYSTRFESERFHFSEDTVDIDDLYRLIGMAFNAIAFDVSNDLALCFNFGSASDLFHALSARVEQIVAPIAEDPLNKPESASTGNGVPPVYSLVRLPARAKRREQFEIEPWVATRVQTAVMLDDRNDRVLFIGKHTIQLWSEFAENKTLQIDETIRRRLYYCFRIQIERHTVRDASYALGILNSFERKSWASEGYRHYETLLDGCKSIIDRALLSYDGDVFDSIESTDESEHGEFRLIREPENEVFRLTIIDGTSNDDSKATWSKILQVLMQFDCERANILIEELLKKEKITLTFDDFEEEKRQSDLSHAISLSRTNIVRSLLLYYYKRATSMNEKSKTKPDFENNLRIVVPEFGQLCEKHPDIALELVKNISYFKSNGPV
ncbi:948_t:CDS:2, partial [Paraglomus occultum]